MAFQPHERRVVFVGDREIGRSSFIAVCMADKPFLGNPPPHIWRPSFVQLVPDLELEELPYVPESTSITKFVQNTRQTQLHVINVDDKAPLEIRSCLYSDATAVVFCFSIADESSFESIKNKWYPEIRHCLPGVPMLLLGMKSDLRDYPHQSGAHGTTGRRGETTEIGNVVSEQRARRLAEALGAEGFLECSAKQDISSIHKLSKVVAIMSHGYTARAGSDRPCALDCGQYRGRKVAWSSSFGSAWPFWSSGGQTAPEPVQRRR